MLQWQNTALSTRASRYPGYPRIVTALNDLYDQEELTLLLSLNIFQNKMKFGLLQLYSTWIQVSQVPEGILGISENLKQGLHPFVCVCVAVLYIQSNRYTYTCIMLFLKLFLQLVQSNFHMQICTISFSTCRIITYIRLQC